MSAWTDLKKAIGASGLPASDRTVYRLLLSEANYKTGELPSQWTPSTTKVSTLTGVSERQVRYSMRHLERHAWLTTVVVRGRGHRNHYRLQVGKPCDCTGRRHEPEKGQPTEPEKGQPETLKGAVSAPLEGQPKGATLQVNGTFTHRQRQEGAEDWVCPDGPNCSCWHDMAVRLLDQER